MEQEVAQTFNNIITVSCIVVPYSYIDSNVGN